MTDIFNYILHSNIFNFTIFMLIIIAICYFIDIGSILDKMRDRIASEINDSLAAKEQAAENLKQANTEYSNLPKEIDNISVAASQKSEALSKQITIETEQKVANIEKNTQNILNAEQKHITSELISKLGLKSVEFAEYNIIEELANNPQLHDKFIQESIAKLDEVVL